jgi:hypothetical protein
MTMVSFLRSPSTLGATSALVALLALLDVSPALACSCAQPLAPDAAMEGADVVFEGQPTEVKPLQVDLGFGGYLGAKRFRFDVTRYFKGQLGPSLPIFTVDQSSACGREYALGEAHVIYARYTDDGLLTDYACSRSGPSSLAAEDLALLGAGLAPDASYPEDLDTAPAAANDSDVESGLHRAPLVTDQPARGCASLASAGSPLPWQPLAAALGAIALTLSRRRR